MTLRIALVSAAEVYALRHDVFVVGQGVDPAIEHDELDATAVHVGAFDGDELVGTGRLTGEPPGPARVGRMAVRADRRGHGVGAAVLRRLEREAVKRGHSGVVLHAQLQAIGFYDRSGYTSVGAGFTEAGIEHQAMTRSGPQVRSVRNDDSAGLISLIGEVWSEYPGCVLDVDREEPWLRAPADAYDEYAGRMWVAELGGAIVACVGVKPVRHGVAELKSLYVAAAARRRGLGEVLVDLVESTALEHGGERIELWSDTRFADAHRLYGRLGYQRAPGTRELHDLSNSVEFAFAKMLTGDADRR